MKISGYYLEATYADNIPLDKRPYFIERYLVSSRIYLAKGEIWIWVDKKKKQWIYFRTNLPRPTKKINTSSCRKLWFASVHAWNK